MDGQRFQLGKDTVGIADGRIIILRAGSVVTALVEPTATRLLRVLHNGRSVLVFSRDMEERGVAMQDRVH